MDFINFPLLLTALVFASGLIWLYDHLTMAPGRKLALERLREDFPEWANENSSQHRRYQERSEEILRTSTLVEYSKSFFPVLLVVFVLRSFLVEPFQIPSSSMKPTLLTGDFILVNKFTYGLRLPVIRTKVWDIDEPRRGDIMVFFPPHRNDTYFIKRVVGLPGDRISYKGKHLYINGEPVQREFLASLPPSEPTYSVVREQLGDVSHKTHVNMHRGDVDFSITVKPGHYFMMGDNRDNSSDSRVWGEVSERDIVGRAFAIWMHWETFFSIPSFQRVGTIE